MAYAASVVSRFVIDPTVRDLVTADKFINLLKTNEVVLSFPQTNDLTKCIIGLF